MTLPAFTGTPLFLALGGLALLVAFGADAIAARWRIPDALWLIALGVLAGPVLGLISASSVLVVAPVVGTAVLVIILFDAGLDMQGSIIRPLLASAVAFACLTYLVSVVVVSLLAYLYLFPGDFALSMFFGLALGATSGAVAIPVANRMGLLPALRGFVHLDAAIEDALAIIFATILLLALTPNGNFSALDLALALTLPIPVGIAIGVVSGVVWLFTLSRWQSRSYAALATLGYVLLTYGVAKLFFGSGILAALLAGIVIANAPTLRRYLRSIRPVELRASVRAVQTELAFLFRALFLFFIGTLVVLANPGLVPLIVVAVLSIVLLGLRYGVARGLARAHRLETTWTPALGGVGGRGLTSAVLLVLPVSVIAGARGLFLPGVLLIVGTDVVMTLWVLLVAREAPARSRGAEPSPGSGMAAAQPVLEGLAREDELPDRGTGPPSTGS